MVNSAILKNLKSLRSTISENSAYIDVRFDGIKDDSVTVTNGDCVITKLKIWLCSGNYDYHRCPTKGGWIEKYLVRKPLMESTCDEAKANLLVQIAEQFPDIQVVDVTIKYTLQPRKWYVNLNVIDKKTGLIGIDTLDIDAD